MVKRRKIDILIYDLEFKDVSRPFNIGKFRLYPEYDLWKHLKGYEEDVFDWVTWRDVKYAYYSQETDSNVRFFSLFEDYYAELQLFVAAFRLLKPGLIQVDTGNIIRAKGIQKGIQIIKVVKDLSPSPEAQPWAVPMHYELYGAEIPHIRSLYKRLKKMPIGYLDVAIKRFNRSYDYWLKEEIDDCFADLVIALESLTSRGGDGILQSMRLRIPLLLKKKYGERKKLEKQISMYYEHRSSILHGGKIDEKEREKRAEILEDLRELVRSTIVRCMKIIEVAQSSSQLQDTMAETIDAYLHEKLPTK
jgi:hypothetical protein